MEAFHPLPPLVAANNRHDNHIEDMQMDMADDEIDQQNEHQPEHVQAAANPAAAAELPLPPPVQDMTRLFALTDQERQWALDLKRGVESSMELTNLNDLHYVQFALYHQGDFDKAMESVAGLQSFREEYEVQDTFEHGLAIYAAFAKMMPRALLSVAYDDQNENYGVIYDRTKIDLGRVQTKKDWQILLALPYYLFNSFTPDFVAMRAGIFTIAECEGMRKSRVTMEAMSRIYYHFSVNNPIKFSSIKFFHTNVLANVAFSMLRALMPSFVQAKFQMGCQFHANLSDLYLLPTPEIATERVLLRMKDFLKRRYDNQAKFSLQ